jgi:hypothetical protein
LDTFPAIATPVAARGIEVCTERARKNKRSLEGPVSRLRRARAWDE